ncbi:unnamed protein product [Brassica oleracea]
MSICASSLGLLQRYERPRLRNRQGVHIQVLERPMSQRPDDVQKPVATLRKISNSVFTNFYPFDLRAL